MADQDPLIRRAETQIQKHLAQIESLRRFVAQANHLVKESPRESIMAEIDIIALRNGTTRASILRLHNRCPNALSGRRETAHYLAAQGKNDSEIGRVLNRDASTIKHILGKVKRNDKPTVDNSATGSGNLAGS